MGFSSATLIKFLIIIQHIYWNLLNLWFLYILVVIFARCVGFLFQIPQTVGEFRGELLTPRQLIENSRHLLNVVIVQLRHPRFLLMWAPSFFCLVSLRPIQLPFDIYFHVSYYLEIRSKLKNKTIVEFEWGGGSSLLKVFFILIPKARAFYRIYCFTKWHYSSNKRKLSGRNILWWTYSRAVITFLAHPETAYTSNRVAITLYSVLVLGQSLSYGQVRRAKGLKKFRLWIVMVLYELSSALSNSSHPVSKVGGLKIYYDEGGSPSFNPKLFNSLQISSMRPQGASSNGVVFSKSIKHPDMYYSHHSIRPVRVGGLFSLYNSNAILTSKMLDGQEGIYLGRSGDGYVLDKPSHLVCNDIQSWDICKVGDINHPFWVRSVNRDTSYFQTLIFASRFCPMNLNIQTLACSEKEWGSVTKNFYENYELFLRTHDLTCPLTNLIFDLTNEARLLNVIKDLPPKPSLLNKNSITFKTLERVRFDIEKEVFLLEDVESKQYWWPK